MTINHRLCASLALCLGLTYCNGSADNGPDNHAGSEGGGATAEAGAGGGGMGGDTEESGGSAGTSVGGGGAGDSVGSGGAVEIADAGPPPGADAAPAPSADAGGVAMSPLFIPPNAKKWTGMGADNRWATPANWSGGTVPTESDDVVLDGTTPKTCVINTDIRVGSITVTPEYQGVFQFSSPGTVLGNLVLSGKVAMSFNPHTSFNVLGPVVDLSRVSKMGVTYAGGNLAFAGANVVQSYYPPANPSVVVSETWVLGGSTTLLKGNLNAIALYVEKGGKLDLNHKNVTVDLIGIAGYASNLGGSTIAVNGFATYTTNGFGFSYHSPNPGIRLDLAPDLPWYLQVHQVKARYGTAPNVFKIVNSDIGNLKATGDPLELVNCTDKGGNTGLVFP